MDLSDLAAANRRRILRLVLRTGGRSRVDIARETGLSRSTVTDITERLIRKGILCEKQVMRKKKRGRPAIELSLDPGKCLVAVAGFSYAAAIAHLADPTGQVVAEESIPLAGRVHFKKYISSLVDAVKALGSGRWKEIQSIAIVGPGVVDLEHGILLHNPLGWKGAQMVEPFKHFRKPLLLQNGSRLRAVAESWYGVAQDVQDFLYFHLDRGIGGAVVLDDSLVIGPSHGAGEFGHMIVDPDGPKCTCGARGCVESLASMPAIVRTIGRKSCRSFEQAWSLFESGNKKARTAFDAAIGTIVRGILTAATAVGPSTILLGGRMVDQTDGAIVDMIQDKIAKTRSMVESLDIRRCEIPDQKAQVLGAVAYALQSLSLE